MCESRDINCRVQRRIHGQSAQPCPWGRGDLSSLLRSVFAFSLSVCLAGSWTCTFAESEDGYEAVLGRLEKERGANETRRQTIDVLRRVVDATKERIQGSLRTEFETGLRAELLLHDKGAAGYLIEDYRNAILATRILGLCDNVIKVPSRRLPESEQERHQAAEQYASVADEFRAADPDIDTEVWHLASNLSIQDLENVQTRLFFPGYGVPLDDGEMAALSAIQTETRRQAQVLTDSFGGSGLAPDRHREAARIGINARGRVLEFLRARDASSRSSEGYTDALNEWYQAHKVLIQTVRDQVRRSEQEEVEAIGKLSDEQYQQRMLQDSPEAIDARQRAAQGETVDRSLQTLEQNPGRWPMILTTGVVIPLLIAIFLFTRLRARQTPRQ